MTHFALSSTHLSPPESPARALKRQWAGLVPERRTGEPSYPHGHGDVDSDSDADGATPHRSAGEPTSTNFRTPVLY